MNTISHSDINDIYEKTKNILNEYLIQKNNIFIFLPYSILCGEKFMSGDSYISITQFMRSFEQPLTPNDIYHLHDKHHAINTECRITLIKHISSYMASTLSDISTKLDIRLYTMLWYLLILQQNEFVQYTRTKKKTDFFGVSKHDPLWIESTMNSISIDRVYSYLKNDVFNLMLKLAYTAIFPYVSNNDYESLVVSEYASNGVLVYVLGDDLLTHLSVFVKMYVIYNRLHIHPCKNIRPVNILLCANMMLKNCICDESIISPDTEIELNRVFNCINIYDDIPGIVKDVQKLIKKYDYMSSMWSESSVYNRFKHESTNGVSASSTTELMYVIMFNTDSTLYNAMCHKQSYGMHYSHRYMNENESSCVLDMYISNDYRSGVSSDMLVELTGRCSFSVMLATLIIKGFENVTLLAHDNVLTSLIQYIHFSYFCEYLFAADIFSHKDTSVILCSSVNNTYMMLYNGRLYHTRSYCLYMLFIFTTINAVFKETILYDINEYNKTDISVYINGLIHMYFKDIINLLY